MHGRVQVPQHKRLHCSDHRLRVILPHFRALGPHDGDVIDWVCVACEQDWYELLCAALECRDVLDKCHITTTSGQKAKVEVMNVAVWRWHERVWDVTTDEQDHVTAPMNFGTRPKMPDAAPNFD